MTTTANLSFVPWVRQGAAAAIGTVDTLGPKQRAVADLSALLTVNASPVLPVPVRLRGPADVVGVDANQIVRMDPRPGSSDFEPNYFPCIEFDRADFPWLFTPLRADTSARLRPWLCLVVVRVQDGVTIGSSPASPLATLTIAAPAVPRVELPDLRESWAWVHAQAAGIDSSPAAVGTALNGAPQLSLSRLLCPRVLAPNTDYVACVVPTFELGRKSALGLPVADSELIATNALAPAWSLAPTPPAQVLLPLLHHWAFRTGEGGDFESLALRLKAQPAPPELGVRAMDISHPGFAPPLAPPQPTTFPAAASIGLEGALQPLTSSDVPAAWPANTQAPFQAALAAIVNTASTSAAANPNADPILAPPLYGRWHMPSKTVAPAGVTWFDQLNLDPRNRVVAAYGTRVVQEHQEALMASAWQQVGQIQQANQRARQLQLSMAVGTSLHARHFAPLAADAALRIVAPAFGRIRTTSVANVAPRTLVAQLASTALPVSATSVAMRMVGRARGPVTRRVAALGVKRATLPSWIATLNVGAFSFVSPPVFDLATVNAIRTTMGGTPAIQAFGAVTSDRIAANPGRPLFQVAAENLPVAVQALGSQAPAFDDASAFFFRAAAVEHLGRINPGRLGIIFGPRPASALADLKTAALAQLHPRVALVALARAVVFTGPRALAPVDTPAAATVGIDTAMAAPKFHQPMYEPLRDLSQTLLLPGIETITPDTVLGLKTNRRFVEAYMVGLNVEMGSELLWRGYPTDQRGTCFDQFWDVRGAAEPHPDINPLSLWANRALGDPLTSPSREQFVMLMSSALLRRYPNAMISAVPALVTNGVRAPDPDPLKERTPAFRGALQPDISFFGFDLATKAVTGADGSAGWYIVIQEHPTEPRFGLDVGITVGGASHLALGSGPPAGVPTGSMTWGRNSAHMAGITRQLPVRIAIHAAQFVATT